MKIDFYLRFRTYMCQSVSISGNLGILGNNERDKALPMNFLTEDYWHVSIELDELFKDDIQYCYLLKDEGDNTFIDAEKGRVIKVNGKNIFVIDSWNSGSNYANVFSTAPFQNVFFKESKQLKFKTEEFYTHIFKIKAPLLTANECPCLLGNANELNNWSTEKPVLLQKEDSWWVARVNLSGAQFSLAYKSLR